MWNVETMYFHNALPNANIKSGILKRLTKFLATLQNRTKDGNRAINRQLYPNHRNLFSPNISVEHLKIMSDSIFNFQLNS